MPKELNKVVWPTHTCFTDSLELLGELLLAARANGCDARKELFLVHAICTAPDGTQFSHAWIEDVKMHRCIFIGILCGKRQILGTRTKEYEAQMNIVECTKYAPQDAWNAHKENGNCGPWLERYRALCTESRKVFMPAAVGKK